MSAVTLETLRAEFEAERDNVQNGTISNPFANGGHGAYVPFLTMLPEYGDYSVDDWAVAHYASYEASLAARRYIIARDFREFDPDRADMIWKLQQGGEA